MTQVEADEVGMHITNHTLKIMAEKYLSGEELDRFLKNITLEINTFDEKLKDLLTKEEIQILNEAIQTKIQELSQGDYDEKQLVPIRSYFINWKENKNEQ